MIKQQKGFSLIEVILAVFVIGVIVLGGWYVYGQQNKSTDSNNKIQSAGSSSSKYDKELEVYRNEEIGIQFSYPKSWGTVSVVDNDTSTKTGKSRTILFDKYPKLMVGVKTLDWEPTSSDDLAQSGIATGCHPEYPYISIEKTVDIYNKEGVCLVVNGERSVADRMEGDSASILLEYVFIDRSSYDAITFETEGVAVSGFSEASLKKAYGQDVIDGFIQVAKSIKEL